MYRCGRSQRTNGKQIYKEKEKKRRLLELKKADVEPINETSSDDYEEIKFIEKFSKYFVMS